MKVTEEGVVAEYEGKFWGTQYSDCQTTIKDFGNLENATIGKSEYYKNATDFTWDPKNTNGINSEYDKLKLAKLVRVRKTITFELL